MKSSFVALLVMVACMERGHSLLCYRCENEPSNWNCLRVVKCAENDKYCLTTTTTPSQIHGTTDYRIYKGCSQICADPKVDVSQGGASTKCCTTDLCNFSGATSVKTSTAVMALGVLASFFYIFRSGL
ncbi:lymphocyte antigen 6E-like [Tiliqua scincoides]|uniref:lymphocyte antigen 6E-like n=1 Tax=Tiliqua scincoides TaxID=71010 RepID=UPI003462E77E